MQKRIGILVPFVNCESYVTALVKSINTMYPYHLVLISNGSKTHPAEAFSGIKLPDSTDLRYHKVNTGCAAAWNEGLHELFTDGGISAVAVLNNDTLLHPQALDLMLAELENPKYAMVTATDMAKKCAMPTDIFSLPLPERRYVSDEPEFSCFMLSRQGYDAVGDFDQKFFPAYFEDNDYHYRATLAGLRCVKLNAAMYYHYGSVTIKKNDDVAETVNSYFLQNEAYFTEKWGGKPGHETYHTPFNGRRHG